MKKDIRSIIHLDMDAFYVSVEQRENPALKGRQVIVGGNRERGVVCACSYPTREHGVSSGMAMAKALRLCPEAVVLPVRMALYQSVSRQVFTLFRRYTDLVEPLSIDEAFLDIGPSFRLHGSGEAVARKIRSDVRSELNLAVSAGIAPNKFLAKLASAEAKPDGLLHIDPGAVDSFLLPLSIEKIWGIGRVAASRLHERGIVTVGELRRLSERDLCSMFGVAGRKLHRLARGEDTRPVLPNREAKSLGAEETFSRDICDKAEVFRQMVALVDRCCRRLRRQRLGCQRVTVKVKYADFQTQSCSVTLDRLSDRTELIRGKAQNLLSRALKQEKPVRLLGVYLERLQGGAGLEEVDLFNRQDVERQRSLDQAVDLLQERFGPAGVRRASLLSRAGSVQGGQVLREDLE